MWKTRTSVISHRIVMLSRERHHLPGLQDELGWDFECSWAGSGLRPDVAYFPFQRVEWDTRSPRVLMVHDLGAVLHESERLKRAVSGADCVVTHSEFARRELLAQLEVPLGKSEVVHPAADPCFVPPGHDPRERAELLEAVTDGIPYILYVGTTTPEKGLLGLLDAFSWLSGQIPHRLVLVCRRPKLSLAQRLIGRVCPIMERVRALGNRVVFLDHVPQERLVKLYQHCDQFVMPWAYAAFPTPLLEAMTCGAPCLAARVGSNPEVGGDAVAWFHPGEPVEMAQAMLEALSTPEPLREAGPLQAARFTWERTAHRLLKILEESATRLSLQTA